MSTSGVSQYIAMLGTVLGPSANVSKAATAKAAQLELGTGKTFTLFLYVSTWV